MARIATQTVQGRPVSGPRPANGDVTGASIARRTTTLAATAAICVGCQEGDSSTRSAPESGGVPRPPGVLATNAFLYYDDLDAAWDFYTQMLGLETAADYGFAKILRVASDAYLTLVDAERGMHSSDEPKSVTVAFVTEQVEGWYEHLAAAGVPMRAEFEPGDGRPHDGFVAIDPEGYFLEFERFNPHPENERLLPVLERGEPLFPVVGRTTTRPRELGVQAMVIWLYYRDLEGAQRFYEDSIGLDLIVDQGWAKVYPASRTGFIGLVDGARGLHAATDEKAVTVALFTDDVDEWFEHMRGRPGFELRTPEILDESGRVRVFVGYDPEGYFLEWDTFLDVEGNERLLELLAARSR